MPSRRDRLRWSVDRAAVPYGFTVVLWTSGGVLIERHGAPDLLQAYLFLAGACGAVALAALLAGRGDADGAERGPLASAVGAAVGLGCAGVVAHAVSGDVAYLLRRPRGDACVLRRPLGLAHREGKTSPSGGAPCPFAPDHRTMITVVGSIAFDAVRTPTGARERMLGGAATHFALAASQFDRVVVVGPVGGDFGPDDEAVLATRGTDLGDLVRVRDGETFFWRGEYGSDLNSRRTLETRLNVFAGFEPELSRRRGRATRCSWRTSSRGSSAPCSISARTPRSSRSTRWTCGSSRSATRCST